jgi:hypothetical protein
MRFPMLSESNLMMAKFYLHSVFLPSIRLRPKCCEVFGSEFGLDNFKFHVGRLDAF